MKSAVEVRTARPIGPLGVASLPRNGQARRRPVLPPFDAHRGRRPRAGDAVPALRLDQLHPPVDRLVGRCTASAPKTTICPASSPSRPRPATAGRATTATPSCRRSIRARPSARPAAAADARHPRSPQLRLRSQRVQRRQLDLLQAIERRTAQAGARRRRTRSRHQLVRTRLADAAATRPTSSISPAKPPETLAPLRHRRARRPTTSAGSA